MLFSEILSQIKLMRAATRNDCKQAPETPWSLSLITEGNVLLHFISSLKYFCSNILKGRKTENSSQLNATSSETWTRESLESPDLRVVPPLNSRFKRQVPAVRDEEDPKPRCHRLAREHCTGQGLLHASSP